MRQQKLWIWGGIHKALTGACEEKGLNFRL
jgi:hypothetical protein